MTLLDEPQAVYAASYLDLLFEDETWGISPPMPTFVAEGACFDFSQGFPWIDGRLVKVATIRPWLGRFV